MTVDKYKFSLSLFSASLASFVFQICIFLSENFENCQKNFLNIMKLSVLCRETPKVKGILFAILSKDARNFPF